MPAGAAGGRADGSTRTRYAREAGTIAEALAAYYEADGR
jgi:hypothetical protein